MTLGAKPQPFSTSARFLPLIRPLYQLLLDPGGNAKQLLSGADFKIGKLSGVGTTLDQASVQLNRKPTAWALQLDSQQVKGSASIPDAKAAPIAINLQYVRLPAPDPTVLALSLIHI